MSDDWNEKIDEHLLSALGNAIKDADREIHDTLLHLHWHHWHPISTAPFNQDLEIKVIEGSEAIMLAFPCRRTNNGDWINVDLGTRITVHPISWRVWQNNKSSQNNSSLKHP